MRYRRAYTPGASYFFTVVTAQRRQLFRDSNNVDVLRHAFREVRNTHPFTIDAIVILPDHLHCIWTLPATDTDFSGRWRLIKSWFTKHYGLSPQGHIRRRTPWQNRFWEHILRDDEDYRQHAEYIHYNPVKHGLVAQPWDWPYSSFRRYVARGLYPRNWGSSVIEFSQSVGKE